MVDTISIVDGRPPKENSLTGPCMQDLSLCLWSSTPTATDSQLRLVYVTLGELRLLPLDLPRVWSRSRMTQ
jgi:hypothetical protein